MTKNEKAKIVRIGKTYWTVPKGWVTGYGTLKGTRVKIPVIMKKSKAQKINRKLALKAMKGFAGKKTKKLTKKQIAKIYESV